MGLPEAPSHVQGLCLSLSCHSTVLGVVTQHPHSEPFLGPSTELDALTHHLCSPNHQSSLWLLPHPHRKMREGGRGCRTVRDDSLCPDSNLDHLPGSPTVGVTVSSASVGVPVMSLVPLRPGATPHHLCPTRGLDNTGVY